MVNIDPQPYVTTSYHRSPVEIPSTEVQERRRAREAKAASVAAALAAQVPWGGGEEVVDKNG